MINYVISQREINVGFSPGSKYLAVIVRNGIMTQEELAERISEMSSLAYNDVISTIAALQMVISDATMNGITVQLKELGNFTPILKSTAVDSIEEADAKSIKRLKVNFYPNVRFKKKLKGTGFSYRNPLPKGFIDPDAETTIP